MLPNLYAHNDWANAKILSLCEGLSDQRLDSTQPIGFGSLRATLFHMWAAEQLWLDRWQGAKWEPLKTDPNGISIADLTTALQDVAEKRNALIAEEAASGFKRTVDYKTTEGTKLSHRIGDLLLHVANHATHHRAQALNFLKQFEKTVPAGLDYIFYKLAYPTIEQQPKAIAGFQSHGLDAAIGEGLEVTFDISEIQSYYAYSDWATDQILDTASGIPEQNLDNEFDMGPGTFRKTITHILHAEEWWHRNWTVGPTEFDQTGTPIPLAEIRTRIGSVRTKRNAMVRDLTPTSAARAITVLAGGPPSTFQVIESMIQLCSHGTHHRAQLVNMLRQLQAKPPAVDYVVWLQTKPA